MRREIQVLLPITTQEFLFVHFWEKNRNFFDFLSHGVEIRFSNFRLGHFVQVEAILSQNETPDEINRVSTSDNSTPSGEN